MAENTYDIAIIGGGLAGLTAARELSGLGYTRFRSLAFRNGWWLG